MTPARQLGEYLLCSDVRVIVSLAGVEAIILKTFRDNSPARLERVDTGSITSNEVSIDDLSDL